VSGRTDLRQLFNTLKEELQQHNINYQKEPIHRDFREGDVRHSQADIRKAQQHLGYAPQYNLQAGVAHAMPWYVAFLN